MIFTIPKDDERRCLQSLAALSSNPHAAVMVDVVRWNIARLDRLARTADGPIMYRFQGAAQVLEDFLKQLADADANARKMM